MADAATEDAAAAADHVRSFCSASSSPPRLSAMARLGVADHMGDDAGRRRGARRQDRRACALALSRDAHARELRRVSPRSRGGNSRSRRSANLLKTDAPGSIRYMAMMLGDEWSIKAYAHMADCITTGSDGITMAYGKQVFDVFADHPEQAETFQQAMTSGSAIAAQSSLAAYDFSGIKRLADVGGGHGILLRLDPRALSGAAGRAVRSAGGGRGRPAEPYRRCGGTARDRGGELLRAGAGRLRRLHDEAHHS